MKPFEYALVVISLIIGLTLSEWAIGVSYMIKNYQAVTLYWPYIVFVALGFLAILNYWASIYNLRNRATWTLPNLGLIFMTGLLFFITARVMFPDQNNFDQNYETYFHKNIGVAFFAMLLCVLSILLESLTIKKGKSLKWYVIMTTFVVLALSGIIFDNKFYREMLSVVMLTLQILNMYSIKMVIKDQPV